MTKLNHDTLTRLIKVTIYPNPNRGGSKMCNPTLGHGQYIRNYKEGEPPNNNNKEPMTTSPDIEAGDMQTHIKGGEIYVTQGKNVYQLCFDPDSEDLSAGYVAPVGQHGFHIVDGRIDWHGQVPMNVQNDEDLKQQIMDYSGRGKNA